jgi:hypothetical protein
MEINNAADDEAIASFTADGAVELRHNNSAKFSTTAAGASITGKALASEGIFTGGITPDYPNVLGGANEVLNIASTHAKQTAFTLRYAAASDASGTIAFYAATQASMSNNTDLSSGIFVQNSQEFGIGHGTVRSFNIASTKKAAFNATDGNWNMALYAGGTGAQSFIDFRLSNNTQVGYISTDGSGTTYGTSSDYRLKENVDYTWDATTRLKQLKPARFNFIADDTNTLVDGFLAHEAATVVPESVVGAHNETEVINNVVLNADGSVNKQDVTEADWTDGKTTGTDPQGNEIAILYASDTTWVATKTVPKYQGIDQAKLVPLLVKTIQELEARITALEA